MGHVDIPPPSKDDTGYAATPDNELLTTIERDWTVDEEKKAKRKYGVAFPDLWVFHTDSFVRLDLLIMPLLPLGSC